MSRTLFFRFPSFKTFPWELFSLTYTEHTLAQQGSSAALPWLFPTWTSKFVSVSFLFPGVLLLWQGCQVSLQLVIYRLLDGSDSKPQSSVPHLARFSPHLSGFYVDESLFFQLPNVLGNRVGAHPCVLTYATDTRPALIRLPVFTENQVGVHFHFSRGNPQSENGFWQKKKSPIVQPFRVSVFDFRGVTSEVIFQNSTPMFCPMSIEKSDFTACSQHLLASVPQNSF